MAIAYLSFVIQNINIANPSPIIFWRGVKVGQCTAKEAKMTKILIDGTTKKTKQRSSCLSFVAKCALPK